MKIAVFGGSFNPLHIGHAMLADTIITELGYDKVTAENYEEVMDKIAEIESRYL